MARFTEYSILGRNLPTEAEPTPKLYRMRIFAPNTVVAKSRFWYFLRQLKKVKKANGEIVGVNVVSVTKEARTRESSKMVDVGANMALSTLPALVDSREASLKVKNFGIWLRYDSRSGTHNMYKEFRELSRVGAVEALYQDLAARHRARFRSVHILRVAEIEKKDDVKRPYIRQLLEPGLKFPLPHRRTTGKAWFAANRPATWA